jgi:hypothetical protein
MILKRAIATIAIIAGVALPASGLFTASAAATLADTPWGLKTAVQI